MDRGQHGNRLLGHVHAGKDRRRLRNPGQTLGQKLRGEVIQVQIAMILLGSHAPALADLHGHGPRNHIPARQVLGAGGVSFHEPLALAVPQYASLAATSLRDEAPRAVDPRGMELHELGILISESRSHRHGVSIPGACVGAGAREVRAAIPPGGQHRVLRLDAMQRSVLHVQGHSSDALSIVRHEQVHGEVFDEVRGVECEGAAVQGVEHGMSGPVGGGAAPVRLPSLPEIQALSSERSLVNLPLLRPAEGQAEFLQFQHGLRGLATHVVDGVLIAEPIGSLDGVVHVPSPIVRSHVPQCRVDPALRRDGVRARGEELGDARGLEPRLGEAHGGA
mmetsp:Transcript_4714/g.11881  ORF Transcript_4714/g.11881 Transcript_4714/m.11881 type:complete len:335 (-) Transcript_4714:384-1388(-)